MTEPADGLGDDRVSCRSCRNLIPWNGKCREQEKLGAVLKDLPRRCILYVPIPKEPDQRTGAERWPGMVEEIEEIRRMDRAGVRA